METLGCYKTQGQVTKSVFLKPADREEQEHRVSVSRLCEICICVDDLHRSAAQDSRKTVTVHIFELEHVSHP